jgi:hypothetical protein
MKIEKICFPENITTNVVLILHELSNILIDNKNIMLYNVIHND